MRFRFNNIKQLREIAFFNFVLTRPCRDSFVMTVCTHLFLSQFHFQGVSFKYRSVKKEFPEFKNFPPKFIHGLYASEYGCFIVVIIYSLIILIITNNMNIMIKTVNRSIVYTHSRNNNRSVNINICWCKA